MEIKLYLKIKSLSLGAFSVGVLSKTGIMPRLTEN